MGGRVCFLRSLLGGFRFTPVKQPRSVGRRRGGDGHTRDWRVRCGVCVKGDGGGDGGKDTVGFTDVLKAEVPPPSPPRAAGTRGTLSPCPTGGGKGGGQFVRGSGQLCHLLAGVRSGRGGRGRGGLYSVPPAAVTAGVPGGEEDTPHRHPPSPPPRAPVHVALGGGGQRTLRFPRPLVGQPGGSWGGGTSLAGGGAPGRAKEGRAGSAVRAHATGRAPPRSAGASALCWGIGVVAPFIDAPR